jgi:hypothetical protein
VGFLDSTCGFFIPKIAIRNPQFIAGSSMKGVFKGPKTQDLTWQAVSNWVLTGNFRGLFEGLSEI